MDTTESREPDELTALQAIIAAELAEIQTAMPAKVERYQHDPPMVDVTPVLKRVFLDDDDQEVEVEYPVITNVPVAFPRGGGFTATWPLKKGDPVWLVFASRSLDSYLETDGTQLVDPQDARRHDISDAIAIPAGGTYKNAQPAHAEDVVVGFENGTVELHIQPNGETWWKIPTGRKFNFGSQAAAKALALAEVCNDRLDKLEGWAGEHVHAGNLAPAVQLGTFFPWAVYGLPSAGVTTESTRVFTDA